MFEIAVATQYLFPRWRRLSLSIISLIALLVVTLVVWLILSFFSVTTSLERGWMEKLITLASPIRVVPTEAYFRSSYYLLDTISSEADFSPRTLQEKVADGKILYNPAIDPEPPSEWPPLEGNLLQSLFSSIEIIKEEVPDLKASFYEVASVSLKLQIKRHVKEEVEESVLSQTLWALSFDDKNEAFEKTLLPPSLSDVAHLGRKVTFRGGDLSDRLRKNLYEGKPSLICNDKGCLPLWVSKTSNEWNLPEVKGWGKGILLPKQFRDVGVFIGDEGAVVYEMATLTSKQEVKHPVYVAGFYDPGLLGMGGKFLLTQPELLSLIRSQTHQDSVAGTEGISLRFNDIDQTQLVKQKLLKEFEAKGIAPYFRVETFRDFEFVKPLLQELTSQKNLFTLLSVLILIVACSNIISLLIILINDKKREIAILRALGASTASIAFIFAFSGLVIGVLGSLLGVAVTLVTLQFVPDLLDLLSWAQGFSAFQTFFGSGGLNITLSRETLFWVMGMTSILSLFSGLIPAIKACLLKPSEALKSE